MLMKSIEFTFKAQEAINKRLYARESWEQDFCLSWTNIFGLNMKAFDKFHNF